MNVENHNLAVRIDDVLNKRGARLDNAAVWTIERVIDASQPDSLSTDGARRGLVARRRWARNCSRRWCTADDLH